MFRRVGNPLSSQIAGCLNKAPLTIQSLSLLVGSGGDRPQEHRPTFPVSKTPVYNVATSTLYKYRDSDTVYKNSHKHTADKWSRPF